MISGFILLNVCAVVFTNSNSAFPLQPVIQRLLLPYARFTRIMQRWSLFCPEPRRYVGKYFFEISFKDHSVRQWHRPDSPKWGYFERHIASHWQKFDTASNHMQDRRLWPDIAQWVKRRFWSAGNPPETIRLVYSIAPTPPPNEHGSAEPAPSAFVFRDHVIFTYSVARGEFL